MDVQLNVDIGTYDSPKKISVMKSLSKKLSIHKVQMTFSNNGHPSYSFKTSYVPSLSPLPPPLPLSNSVCRGGELYLERVPQVETFIKKNYIYFAIGGGILLVILVLLAIQIRRVVIRRRMYSSIN